MRSKIFSLLYLTLTVTISYGQQDMTNWKWLGPQHLPAFKQEGLCANGMGLIQGLYVDPANPLFLLAGSNTGGLFRTRDGGIHWENLTDDQLPLVTGVGSIVADPFAPGRYYMGTGTTSYNRQYGLGVWVSEDEGTHWKPTGLTFDPEAFQGRKVSVRKLIMHPLHPGTIYALLHEGAGSELMRSRDAGQNWTSILLTPGEKLYDMELDPGNPEVLYLGGQSFWYSSDEGRSWDNHLMDAPEGERIHRVALAVHPRYGGHIWALYSTGGQRGIVVSHSSDGGKTFATRGTHSPWHVNVDGWKMEFDVGRHDTSVLYAGGVLMQRSLDGGRQFNVISSNRYPSPRWMHVDARGMQVLEGKDHDHIYIGHDGGVSVSLDGGDTWTDISGDGLGVTQFWRIALDPERSRILGGTQDLGALMFEEGIWRNVGIYGDAYEGVFLRSLSDTVIITVHSGLPGMKQSQDGGKSWKDLPYLSSPGRNDRPLISHPEENGTLLAGYQDIFISQDAGKAWDKITNFRRDHAISVGDRLVALAVSVADPEVYYAAFGEPCWGDVTAGKVFKSVNAGKDWKDISQTLPGVRWAGITDLLIHPRHAHELWVSLDGFWTDDQGINYKVFHSRDGGESWENVSGGLRNVPVNRMRYLPSGWLIAATDAGVFISRHGKGDWQPLGQGLPPLIISDLEVDEKKMLVYASSFGRGLYMLDLQGSIYDQPVPSKRFLRWFRKKK